MSGKTRIVVVMLSAALAFYAIVGGFLFDRSATAKGNQWAQLRIFDEVLRRVALDYVDEPDMERVRTGALRGLAEGLDPYSAYLTPQQVAEFHPIEPGLQDVGGMTLSKVGGYLYIVSVIKGSPAEQAGIMSGDFVEYVGKVATQGISLYDAEMLVGSKQAVDLKIVRRGQPMTIAFTSGEVVQPAVESKMLEPGIGYIAIPTLSEGRAGQVKTAIDQLVAKGAKRLVVDLRGCAFGKLEEGTAVADLFLDSGVLARKLGHNNQQTASISAKNEDTVFRGPVNVLVDRTSAGASEVVAAALAANKRGDVVGDKTFGAGVELGLFKLRDGGALLITTAQYAPPAGKPFMEEPVTPSVLVAKAGAGEITAPEDDEDEEPAEDADAQAPKVAPKPAPKPQPPAEDVQLKKALEVLKAAGEAAGAARAA
jgi:carboxyl-terminal processing protease